MDKIILEIPSDKRECEALEYRKDFKDVNSSLAGDSGLGDSENYKEWVRQKQDWSKELNLPDGFVPATTYFVIREVDDRIVGMIDLRHHLNDYLKDRWMGHIGYAVRPGERRKGYATEMLRLALKEYKKRGIYSVIVGCDEDNIGSKKIILKCGGKLVDRSEYGGKMHLGFEIELGDIKRKT